MMYQHAKFGCKWSSVSEDTMNQKIFNIYFQGFELCDLNLVNIAALALYMILSLSVTINIHKNIPLKNVYCSKDMQHNKKTFFWGLEL